MTRAVDQGPIHWRQVLRLAGGLRPTRGWPDWVILTLFVAFLALILFPASSTDRAARYAAGAGGVWFLLVVYGLHHTTGLLNRGWRVLPVSMRERRAAAWVMVAVLPLVVDLVVTLVAVVAALLLGHHDAALPAVAGFGLRGLAVELYALVAVCFGNWPASATYLWNVSYRQPRDWMMVLLMFPIGAGIVIGSDAIAHDPALAWMATASAIAMCAVLLPVTLRLVRLDCQPGDTGVLDGMTDAGERWLGLRFSGWSGHFARQAVRTLGIWALIAVFEFAAQVLVPAPAGGTSHEIAFYQGFRQGLTFGTASILWVVPAMGGAFVATMTQQYLLRARLLLLSLPRGEWLVLTTPAFNAALVFAGTLALVWPHVVAEPEWGLKLLVSVLYGLAMLYLALACNLGVTSYARQMATGLVIGLTMAGVGAFAAVSDLLPHRALALLAPIGGASLVVLIAALVWCRWQLRQSRAPYRPWPGTAASWRTA